MSQPENENTYQKISPTALLIAYLRAFTDIDDAENFLHEIFISPSLAPRYEARYKLIDKVLNEIGCIQVLEIAAGYSPRGLQMATRGVKYVEFDLPSMIAQKKALIEDITKKRGQSVPDNLIFHSGNALDKKSLLRAMKLLDPSKPVAIINEGLMRYLGMPEKKKLAQNIHACLQGRSGTWITPDITLEEFSTGPMKGLNQKLRHTAGVGLKNNTFTDVESAIEFFSDQGFNVLTRSFLEVSALISSAKNLKMGDKEVRDMNKSSVLFVLRPRGRSG